VRAARSSLRYGIAPALIQSQTAFATSGATIAAPNGIDMPQIIGEPVGYASF
jgi:hypothetical protein